MTWRDRVVVVLLGGLLAGWRGLRHPIASLRQARRARRLRAEWPRYFETCARASRATDAERN